MVTSISGSYVVSDTAGIAVYIDSVLNVLSGASVFTYTAGGNKIFVGVTQGSAA